MGRSICSWITRLVDMRPKKLAFGERLPIDATIAETQISTVSLVDLKGEHAALKLICFACDRRHVVEREAAAQRRCQEHENVLTLLKEEVVPTLNSDVLELRLLFPYLEGGTVADALARQPSGLDEQDALSIFAQMAAAIAHCHERGVVHRDLKLTNVLRDGCAGPLAAARWVLADFGSALLTAEVVLIDTKEALALARDDVQELTTPEYRAPEQVALEIGSLVGPAVDVWALGVALHQIAFGQNPFASPLATLSERPPAAGLQRASEGLRALLDGTLRREPSERLTADRALAEAKAALTLCLHD